MFIFYLYHPGIAKKARHKTLIVACDKDDTLAFNYLRIRLYPRGAFRQKKLFFSAKGITVPGLG
jgi:hypothetical protein